jgi:hypothetical protein
VNVVGAALDYEGPNVGFDDEAKWDLGKWYGVHAMFTLLSANGFG